LRKKIITWLKTLERWHDFYSTPPTTLINTLKRDGILITAGEGRHAPLLFLHRTFHEYLTARCLADRANESGWQAIADIINQKAWLPNWQEVIILLAGQLDNPAPLLELLADEREDDYFRHRLALVTLCLPEIDPHRSQQHTSLVNQIATELFELGWQHGWNETLHQMSHLERALPVLGTLNGMVLLVEGGVSLPDLLTSRLHHQSNEVKKNAANMVGKRACVTPAILDALANLLRDDDWSMRNSALNAVKELGEAAAMEAFLSALANLLRDEDSDVRSFAADAVKELGSSAATEAILT